MEQKSGGLSKGCLIGLIIAGGLLVIIILIVVLMWYYREPMTKWATTSQIKSLKAETAKHPEIVDTARFNAFVDSFSNRMNAEPLDWQLAPQLVGTIQAGSNWLDDKLLDSVEIGILSDALIGYFPDLEPLRPIARNSAPVMIDSVAVGTPSDSVMSPGSPDTAAIK